jgi:hypothetical protein
MANLHVVHKQGQWFVEEEKQPEPISSHRTREEAREAGRELAKARRVELLIHREDGTIGERDSYGGDSPAKG